MIKTFSMSRLSNADYVQFMDYVMTLVADKNPTTLNVKPQHDLLTQKVTEMKDIFKTAQSSNFSDQIFEADSWRDQMLSGILTTVEANTFHYDQVNRDSAASLQKNLRLYGSKIISDNYQTETAKIESIIGDWRNKTDLAAATDNLGLISWIAELENGNNEFKRLYALRTDEYSQKTDENMKSKRVEVTEAYAELCKFLNSYSVTNSNPAYELVIAGINAYIDQYATLLKQTGSRKKVEKPAVN